MSFEKYEKYIHRKTMKRYIVDMGLFRPTSDFDMTQHESEVKESIEHHNTNAVDGQKMTFLDVEENQLIIGLEISDEYIDFGRGKSISKYIGQTLTRRLTKTHGWDKFTTNKSRIMHIRTIAEYNEDD